MSASMVRRPMSSSMVHHVTLPPLPSQGHGKGHGKLVNNRLVHRHETVATEPGVSVIDLESLERLECSMWLKYQLGLNHHQQPQRQRQPITNNNQSLLVHRRATRPESAPACLPSSIHTTRGRLGSAAINSTMTSSSPRPLADSTNGTSSRTRRRRPLGATNTDYTQCRTIRRESDIFLRATQILRDDTTTVRLLSAGGNTRHHVTLMSSTTDLVAPRAESNVIVSEEALNSDVVDSTETDDIIHSTRSDDVIEIPTVTSTPTSTETDDIIQPQSKQMLTWQPADNITNTAATELDEIIETSIEFTADKMATGKELDNSQQDREEISEESTEYQPQQNLRNSMTSSQTVKNRRRELRGGKVRFNDTATVVHEYRPMTPEMTSQ